jgi:hypothetical protein
MSQGFIHGAPRPGDRQCLVNAIRKLLLVSELSARELKILISPGKKRIESFSLNEETPFSLDENMSFSLNEVANQNGCGSRPERGR